jgi:hypothetical protein
LSSKICKVGGNGKIDRTPSPVDLRKIKRIGFKVFFYLKELFENFRARDLKFSCARGPRLNVLRTRRHTPWLHLNTKQVDAHKNINSAYEPTDMARAYDSALWQWRRVAEWYRYINDPMENIKGHMTT